MRDMTRFSFRLALFIVLLAAVGGAGFAEDIPFALPLLWPEDQRAFVQDGTGLLLDDELVAELLDLDAVGRDEVIARFLSADPVPETEPNELVVGIAKRRDLVRGEFLSFLDDRARLLFLHGAPDDREIIDCAETFKPIEVWRYATGDVDKKGQPVTDDLVLYEPKPGLPYRLWTPIESKQVLYNEEMRYWLQQWEELRRQLASGRRFDRQICDRAKMIDDSTGVDGLFGFLPDRPTQTQLQAFLEKPDDLHAWAVAAAHDDIAEIPRLSGADLSVYYPDRDGQRMTTRMLMTLPPELELEPIVERDKREYRLVVEGQVERDAKVFDTFRMRFLLPVPENPATPLAMIVDRPLRPGEEFLMRLKITEEVGGRVMFVNHGFVVPRYPTPPDEQPRVPDEMIVALGEALKQNRVAGHDSLVLIPPESDVVFGLWRAEALVTGTRIAKVVFYLDDQKLMTRRKAPFTAEMRLATQPTEQLVRAEGYDDVDQLVAADEVVVNQPRGELQVRIIAPTRGAQGYGEMDTRVEVIVPEEKRVEKVEFLVNDVLQKTLTRPPWEATLDVPVGGELTYITAAATLDDGLRAEDVRFLNSPEFLDRVDVNLVELYTTVSDKNGRLVKGLTAQDFAVWEDDRPQEISKFELVENLPLTLGLSIDTSGSMWESIGEAQRAAIGFLENIVTPRDRTFALSFADRPTLLMQRTSDVGAVTQSLAGLVANGATSLHDAIVTSLYYYRGIRGRRALVILSDGEDTASSIEFPEALEYARRSGVVIYTIGLRIGRTDIGVRRKLDALAGETGGRAFYIKEASELDHTYGEIEEELRSQYLVAYSSNQPSDGSDRYRVVKIEARGGKLKARTIRGYYP